MTREQLLQELMLNPDFAALPEGWRGELVDQILQNGLGSVAQGNLDWARSERSTGMPGSTAAELDILERWARAAQQNANLESVPLEQDLLDRVVDIGYDDLDRDVARRAEVEALLQRYQPAFDGARNTIAGIYDGSLLASEYGANTEAATAQQAALDTQMDTRRQALESAIAKLYEAQDPLNTERLSAANTLASSVNLGVERERDRILSDFAQDGYVGGSSGTDAALARATIDGRQRAAEAMGAARIANATDMAGMGRYGATEERGLADYGAGETRGIADAAAQRRLGFFTNDVNRRLASLALPANAVKTELDVRNMADDYGQTGLNRFFRNLQNFRTNGAPPPQYQPFQTQPVHNGYENLGAGLVSLAGSVGNANNWWQTPKSAEPTNQPNPASMTPSNSGYSAPGFWMPGDADFKW